MERTKEGDCILGANATDRVRQLAIEHHEAEWGGDLERIVTILEGAAKLLGPRVNHRQYLKKCFARQSKPSILGI